MSTKLGMVDHQVEVAGEELGRLAHHRHPVEEDFKVFDHMGKAGVNGQVEGNGFFGGGDEDFAAGGRIVHPVVDVKVLHRLVLHAAAVDVGFVGDDQRGRDFCRRVPSLLLMVADGVHDQGALVGRHSHARQDTPGNQAAAEGVVLAVEQVADVVEITGNVGQFLRAFGVIEFFEDGSGRLPDQCGVAFAMLGIAKREQGLVSLLNEGAHFFVAANVVDANH